MALAPAPLRIISFRMSDSGPLVDKEISCAKITSTGQVCSSKILRDTFTFRKLDKVTYDVNVLHVLVLLAEIADVDLSPHLGVLAVGVAPPLQNYLPLVEKYLSKGSLLMRPVAT